MITNYEEIIVRSIDATQYIGCICRDSEPLKAILKAQTYAEALDLLKANLAQITDNAEKARAYDKLMSLQ